MKLELSENIKKMRRERGLSQEQLGEKLGVTSQAISHWECGVAYPDMEFLPVIAGFFGVTTDALLGVSSALAEERKHRYWIEHKNLVDPAERIALFKRALAEFPDEWKFALHLCYDMQSDPAYLDEMRDIVYSALDKCTDQELRGHFIFTFSESETEDRIDDFLGQYAEKFDLRYDEVLENRYSKRGEKDKFLSMSQKCAVRRMEEMLYSVIDSSVSDKDPAATVKRVRANLDFLNAYIGIDEKTRREHPVSGDGVPDLWFETRIKNGAMLSCRLAAMGKIDESLDILEDAVTLYEKFFAIKTGDRLSYRLDSLGLLDGEVTRDEIGGEEFDGKVYDRINWIKFRYFDPVLRNHDGDAVDKHFFAEHILGDFTVYNRQRHWFDPVREHPRFKDCMDRMKKAAFGEV